MFRRTIIFALLAVATPALAQTSGNPAPTPRLKPSATIAGDLVRIGDLVENAGSAASIAVFRAPDLGRSGSVTVARVLDALRPHNMLVVDTAGLDEIEVKRASRTIAAKDVEARIARALSGQYGLSDASRLSFTFDREPRALDLEPSAGSELQVMRAQYDPRSTRFDVTFAVPGSQAPLRFSGSVIDTVDAVTLTRPFGRGEVIRASDIVIERRPKAEMTSERVVNADEAVGLAARQAMRAGQPLRRADLMKPEVIKRDDTVTLIYEVPGIMLTVRGKALDAGALGDTISVLNTQSKRTVQGTISGPNRVTIASTIGLSINTAAADDADAQRQSE